MARGAFRLVNFSTRLGEPETHDYFVSGYGGKKGNSGDEMVDFMVGVMFLAVVFIVGVALLGNQLANILHHA